MSIELTGLCREHSFESATALCRRCGLEYCEICVVFPFGEKKPYCKECAMALGGVRSHVTRPAMTPRLVKQRAKQFKANGGAIASAPLPEPEVPTIVDTTIETADEPESIEPAPVPADVAPPPPTGEPAEGVAPSVDWNNPFA